MQCIAISPAIGLVAKLRQYTTGIQYAAKLAARPMADMLLDCSEQSGKHVA